MARTLAVLIVMAALLPAASPSAGQVVWIRVDPEAVLRTLPPQFHGVNVLGNAWDPLADSPGTEVALRSAGFTGMRFPGGQPAD
ncbi:MAG: hypothetical protein AAFY88_31360, partial [Acidobacteriota bacterium]